MSMTGTDETLELIADVAREAVTFDGARIRRTRDSGGELDRDRWAQLAQLGWLGIMVPEERGGSGLTLEAVAIIARRMGHACAPEPFVAAGVLAPAVLAVAAGDQADELLADIADGSRVVAVAWQGPQGGLDEDAIPAEATADGEHDRITGRLRHLGVAAADDLLVAARCEGGVAVYRVPVDGPGVAVSAARQADGMRSLEIDLDGVRVPRANRLIEPSEGWAVVSGAVEQARVAVAAELVGVMDRVLELTVEYLGQREQFGKPIGTLQALQHRLTDAWIQRELSAAATDAAVARLVAGAAGDERAAAASGAKARASKAASLLVRESLQLHGAIGFTDEYDLGLYLNRTLTLAAWLGNAAAHQRRYAALIDITADRGTHV